MGLAVGAIINEAFEVATRRDRHFGFGGELLGIADINGVKTAVYEDDKSLGDMLFGRDISRVLDYNGNVLGFSVGSGIAVATNAGYRHLSTAEIYSGISVIENKFSDFVRSGYNQTSSDVSDNFSSDLGFSTDINDMLQKSIEYSLDGVGISVEYGIKKSNPQTQASQISSIDLEALGIKSVSDLSNKADAEVDSKINQYSASVIKNYQRYVENMTRSLPDGYKDKFKSALEARSISGLMYSVPGGMSFTQAVQAVNKANWAKHQAQKQNASLGGGGNKGGGQSNRSKNRQKAHDNYSSKADRGDFSGGGGRSAKSVSRTRKK